MLPAAFWCFEGVPAKSAGPGAFGPVCRCDVDLRISAGVDGEIAPYYSLR